MSKKITYEQVVSSLMDAGWYSEVDDDVNVTSHINAQTRDSLAVILLADIAKSLRVLRCSNFIDIPRRLNRLRVATEGLRRETRQRARAHRRRL